MNIARRKAESYSWDPPKHLLSRRWLKDERSDLCRSNLFRIGMGVGFHSRKVEIAKEKKATQQK
jgi:hypothetical protein